VCLVHRAIASYNLIVLFYHTLVINAITIAHWYRKVIVERAQDNRTGLASPLGSEKYRHIKRKVYCSIIRCLDVAFAEYEPAIELSGIIRIGVVAQ